MASTFLGLEIGKSGLTAASVNLNITGHNISNVDTAGYTRQRVSTSALEPSGMNYVISQINSSSTGQGVEITGIQQIRSDYLDLQYRNQNSEYTYGEYTVQGLTYLESVMNELEDSGTLSEAISDFFTSLNTLAGDTTSQEYRMAVQQKALALTESFNDVYEQLQSLWSDQNTAINTVATEINSKLESIAELNGAIADYESSGETANDLRDERNLLLDELSGLVDITYSDNSSNSSMVDVQIAGISVVSGEETNLIVIDQDATTEEYSLSIDSTELTADNVSGALGAHFNLRDNDTAVDSGIPYYINQLNELAAAIAEDFNTLNQTGYTYPTDSADSELGGDFFETSDGTSTITAGNITLAADIVDSVYNIAASDADLDTSTTESGNAVIASQMAALLDSEGYDSTLTAIATQLGVTVESAETALDNDQSLLESIDTQRTSVSGVSIDEETTNLIKYQQAYNACARVVTTIDEMLDKLINGTGQVGL